MYSIFRFFCGIPKSSYSPKKGHLTPPDIVNIYRNYLIMKVVSVKTYFVRQPERQWGEELRRQLWWPCPSSSLRRAPLGALTSQCSLSLLFAQPPPPRAVEACSAALWAVVQFPAGGDRGLCQCASVPPQNPNPPPPAGAIAPHPGIFLQPFRVCSLVLK